MDVSRAAARRRAERRVDDAARDAAAAAPRGRDIVVVLGPFRSGTSLTCQILQRLGVDFGAGSAFWPADRFNPGGFLERLDVNHANGRLLESIGLRIVDPADPREVLERADRRVLDAADLTWMNGDGRSAACGLKDPRLCFTLAAWVAAGRLDAARLRLVIVSRDVAAVADSMLAYPTLRDMLRGDRAAACALASACAQAAGWQARHLGLDDGPAPGAGPPRVARVAYERLVTDPAGTTRALAALIGVRDRAAVRAAARLVGKRGAMARYAVDRARRKAAGVLRGIRPSPGSP